MRKQISLIILSIIFGTISCSDASDGLCIKKTDSVLKISGTPTNTIANIGNNLKSFQDNGRTILYSLSWKDEAVFIGDMEHGLSKVTLEFLAHEIEFSHETDMVLFSPNEAHLLDNTRRIFSVDLRDKNYSIFDLNSVLNDALYPISYWAHPMIALNDSILEIPCTYDDLFLTEKKAFETYFSRPPVLHLDLNKDSIVPISFGIYPEKYQGGVFFDDLYCRLTQISESQRIVSYACSDSIDLYTKGLREQYFMGYTPTPTFVSYDLKKLTKMQYKRKYTIEQPRYLQVVYDPYRNLVYRVFKHSSAFTDSDGKVTASKDIAWSLILSDTHFEEQKIISFDDGVYSPIGMVPVPEGLFIQKYTTTNNSNEIAGSIFGFHLD
jgi:hypothetical protein